jgi:hypothetical protein
MLAMSRQASSISGQPLSGLVRAGNVLQILFSSSFEAEYLYKELVERHKRAEEKLKGD